ncbi:MAG: M23 family metallopeptidase [Acidobacteria bacterium]|nr:M23 family metallopeptidase [Acidobacteriota bacterium]
MKSHRGLSFALLTISLSVRAAEPAPVSVRLLPETPLVETTRGQQLLNFDLFLESRIHEPLEITSIEVSVLSGKALVAQRRLGTNGDSILTVPDRALPAGGKLVVFNPFHAFPQDLRIETLAYEFIFSAPGGNDEKARAQIVVKPRPYTGKTRLSLPVAGRLLVHDGHDFYSHHRRLDVTGGMTTALGITSNFGRYAYDLCVVDEQGRMYSGTGEKNEDWFGFGAPVLAPGDGTVVSMANDRPDNTKSRKAPLDRDAVMKNVKLLFGNYVILDHGNGEYSFLAHLKQGSVTVKAGDSVKRGRKIGEMGFSGDAFLVHLHYQVQSDAGFGEGLPSYFEGFKRANGAGWTVVNRDAIDTGDVVERLPRKP